MESLNKMLYDTIDIDLEKQVELTEYQKVQMFTKATGFETPDNKPRAFDTKDLDLISKMVIDELSELLSTRLDTNQAKLTLIKHVLQNEHQPKKTIPDHQELTDKEKIELIAEQADAIVDLLYYLKNASAKKNIKLDEVFNEVHEANMRKIDPKTGKCLKRSDGKILKPPGWVAPNIEKVIEKQFNEQNTP